MRLSLSTEGVTFLLTAFCASVAPVIACMQYTHTLTHPGVTDVSHDMGTRARVHPTHRHARTHTHPGVTDASPDMGAGEPSFLTEDRSRARLGRPPAGLRVQMLHMGETSACCEAQVSRYHEGQAGQPLAGLTQGEATHAMQAQHTSGWDGEGGRILMSSCMCVRAAL